MVTALTVLSLDQGNIHRSAVYHRERLVEQQQEASGECAMGRRDARLTLPSSWDSSKHFSFFDLHRVNPRRGRSKAAGH